MADVLDFHRIIYSGEPNTLGTGLDADGKSLNSEEVRCEDAAEWEAKQKQGWRLTRELPADGEGDKAPAKSKK